MDTIYALATARGKAGVAVIRMSGPHAFDLGKRIAGSLPRPRQSGLRRLRDQSGEALDSALVLCFGAGASFTGEDVVEFHLHGSAAVVSAVLAELALGEKARLAEPGEFTRRALEHGCLDLAQVEGLGDLLEAETEAQRKQAQRLFDGALGEKADSWRRDLIRAMSLLEATIDFADEDVPVDVTPEVLALLDGVAESLTQESNGSRISERIRDGFEIAIIGSPNAGKSTLLNRLAGRMAAITSEVAGTTRDVIEVRMDLGGLPVTVLDTAGLREASDHVEGLGIELAKSRAARADLRVFLQVSGDELPIGVHLEPDDIVVVGKSDLMNNNNALSVSGLTGDGVVDLLSRIEQVLQKRASGAMTATRLRHRLAIDNAISLLDSARSVVVSGSEVVELASEDLRLAVYALNSLIGRVDVEDVLDEIFARFCLGK